MTNTTAQAIDLINLLRNDSSDEQILAALEDGEFLAKLAEDFGIECHGPEDDEETEEELEFQAVIEEAHSILENCREWEKSGQDEVIALDLVEYEVKRMTQREFIQEYAEETNSPIGITKKYWYDPETLTAYTWMLDGRTEPVFSYLDAYEAHQKLFSWAIADAKEAGIEIAYSTEGAVKILDDIIESEDRGKLIAALNSMKREL